MFTLFCNHTRIHITKHNYELRTQLSTVAAPGFFFRGARSLSPFLRFLLPLSLYPPLPFPSLPLLPLPFPPLTGR